MNHLGALRFDSSIIIRNSSQVTSTMRPIKNIAVFSLTASKA